MLLWFPSINRLPLLSYNRSCEVGCILEVRIAAVMTRLGQGNRLERLWAGSEGGTVVLVVQRNVESAWNEGATSTVTDMVHIRERQSRL